MMNVEEKPKKPNIAITVGEGKTNPQGIYLRCDPTVKQVAALLRKQPFRVERWWSMHLWNQNKRSSATWMASSGIVIDIDYRLPDENPPAELIEKFRDAVMGGDVPGSCFHLTPHGARLIWVYEKFVNDRELQKKAERGAGVLVAQTLERLQLTDYKVDTGLLGDLARFFYTPNCIAKDVRREADVLVMNNSLTKPEELAKHDTPVRSVENATPKAGVVPVSPDIATAMENWNKDHPGNWPRHSGQCPVCGDNGSFGHLPEDTARWYCFSSDHTVAGVRGDKGFHGDALDLEAHRRGCKPIDVLRKDGYLVKKIAPTPPPPPDVPEGKPVGAWHAHSYFTAVDLIEKNHRNILENRKIELNEMSGEIEIGRQPIRDADAHRIRYLIEKFVKGGVNSQGNQIGLQLSSADIFAAIGQIAAKNSYHPVRDYLGTLKWDGKPHIEKVLKMLGAEDSTLNQMLVRRFFVSAVARPLKPGCKVDTVFILVGPQGAQKSSFFDALSEPWFIDTPIDITGDPVRAYMTMRKAWLLEWAELEALLRAKRETAVKAFISSRSDSYVPKHARFSITVARSGIIVGSSNPTEFLEDETGERRYWPITIGEINLEAVRAERDQLWAQAVHLFKSNERWWLNKEEDLLLAPRHSQHKVSDVWAERVFGYAERKHADGIGFTTGDVLRDEIVKETAQWNRSDEMRISKILKAYGYTRTTDAQNSSRKVWLKIQSRHAGQPLDNQAGRPKR